jgi:hypothetical protein
MTAPAASGWSGCRVGLVPTGRPCRLCQPGQRPHLDGRGQRYDFRRHGNDNVLGNEGNDLLTGSEGNDTLVGGSGGDLYIFFSGSGADQINGFVFGEGDRITLQGQTYTLGSSGDGDALLLLSGAGTIDQRHRAACWSAGRSGSRTLLDAGPAQAQPRCGRPRP